jgi:hypothetical protein
MLFRLIERATHRNSFYGVRNTLMPKLDKDTTTEKKITDQLP